jgi:hypothetical protein
MMRLIKKIPFLFILFQVACKPLQKQLIGTYIESSLHDTLQLFSDHTYGYDEKLMNGVIGWTTGNWTINGKEISFVRNPRPLMGFHSKLIKDSASNHTVFYLFLGDTEKPVEIVGASVYKEEFLSPLKDALISSNRIELLSTAFDSIEVNTLDYYPITFGKNLFIHQTWRVQIYPAERYYLLDKYIFRYYKKELKNKNMAGSPQVYINFKKINGIGTKENTSNQQMSEERLF